MSVAAELLADLRRQGFSIAVKAANLKLTPASRLTPELRALVVEHKPALLALLAGQARAPAPARPCPTCRANTWYQREIPCDDGAIVGDWLCSRCHPNPSTLLEPSGKEGRE